MRFRWWVVANPKIWKWEQLFREGSVRFRLGRLKRHYPMLRIGDLVLGYKTSPGNRLVAIASVSEQFHEDAGGDQWFGLRPISIISASPSYKEMKADEVLAGSEPMRNLNRGILFSLTREESDRVLALLPPADFEAAAQAISDLAGSVT